MKNLIVMLIAFFAASAAFAQSPQQPSQSDTAQSMQKQNYQDMVKIRTSELPETVQSTILSPEYNGWQIKDAYRSNDNTGYTVNMKKGSEEKTFRFDAEGKLQEGDDQRQQSPTPRPE